MYLSSQYYTFDLIDLLYFHGAQLMYVDVAIRPVIFISPAFVRKHVNIAPSVWSSKVNEDCENAVTVRLLVIAYCHVWPL